MEVHDASEIRTLLTGLEFGECPRWHDGRLWVCDWGTQEVIAVDMDGRREVMARIPTALPFSIDWLPDGRLLVVCGPERVLLRQEPEGALATYADLTAVTDRPLNELVVDGRGNAYVDGIGFDMMSGEDVRPGLIALVTPAGAVRPVAGDMAFPNGMAITPDNATLIVAESYGKRLTAFDIASDGGLSHRRVWADLGDGVPDGICIDASGAVWYADVPNQRCVRVREGGEVLGTVPLDRGGFACMLGGAGGRTLFVLAKEWAGPQAPGGTRTGQVLSKDAPEPGAGWPLASGLTGPR